MAIRFDNIEAINLLNNQGEQTIALTNDQGIIVSGNVAMATGNATGKFAVKSTGVHASYDFYNDGTSYFNGGVTVDAGLSQTGGADVTFSGDVYIPEYIYHSGDTNTYIRFTADTQTFRTGGDDRLILTNTTATFAGTISASNFSGSSSGTNTGDQTNISGNAATATTAAKLTDGGGISTHPGTSNLIYTGALGSSVTGLFAASDNSNSILTVNRHSGDYNSQLGFSSNGNLYYRKFSNSTAYTTQGWNTIAFTNNASMLNSNVTLATLGAQAAGSYAAASHTHAASDITSGNLSNARLNEYLDKYTYQTYGSAGVYMPMVKGGLRTGGASSTTGRLRIKLPHYKAAIMQSFVIDVYEYNTDRMQSYIVSGYSYVDTNATWYNTSAIALADSDNRNLSVRFGSDETNDFQCVSIGETNTTWEYPQVVVRNYMGGHDASSAEVLDSWTIEFVTTDSATYDVTHTNNQPVVDGSRIRGAVPLGNGGTGSITASGARTNLGLGSAATTASTDYATSAQGTLATNALPQAGGTLTGHLTLSNTNAPSNLAELNIGYSGGGETRAIDIHGNWSTNESKSITFTHGSTAANMVAQINALFTGSSSKIRWGKLYHSGDSSTYTMELLSTSLTTANLTVSGNIAATNFSGSSSGTNTGDQDLSSFITSQRAISSTPTDGATTTAISSDWAFDNVKTAVPANALFTDANTTYSAGTGLDLTGTTFSVEPDLRDGITHVGKDSNNYIQFDPTNGRIDFYTGGEFVARLESDGDLHVKGDVIAYSNIFS